MQMPQLRQVDPRNLNRQKSLDEQEKMKLEIENKAKHKTKFAFNQLQQISFKTFNFNRTIKKTNLRPNDVKKSSVEK